MLFFPPFPTISRHFPLFFGPPSPGAGVRAPSAVLAGSPWCNPATHRERRGARLQGATRECPWASKMSGLSRPIRQRGRRGSSRNPNHSLHGSRVVRPFFWSEPGPRQCFSRITKHESRNTAFFAWVASPETAVRTTAPAGKSLLPCSPLFTIVHDCSPLFAIVRQEILSGAGVPAPPGRCFAGRVRAAWRGYRAACAGGVGGEPVSLPRQPFAVGLAASVDLRASPDAANAIRTHAEKGERSSLHFLPRGEKKCVRGPSRRGASRLACATRPLRFSRITSHETRITAFSSCASTVGW